MPDQEIETEPADRVALRIVLAKVQGDGDAQDFWIRALYAGGPDALLTAFGSLAHDFANLWIIDHHGGDRDAAVASLQRVIQHDLGLL